MLSILRRPFPRVFWLLVLAYFSVGTPQGRAEPEICAAAINDYLAWRHGEIRGDAVGLRYTDRRRKAFEAVSSMARARFELGGPEVGLSKLSPDDRPGLVDPGSLALKLTSTSGDVYSTRHAQTSARINLFRHGPHYIDARIFDLIPTSRSGKTLPIKGELVLHIWADRLYVEAKLHAERSVALAGAQLTLDVDAAAIRQVVVGEGTEMEMVSAPTQIDRFSGRQWIGLIGNDQTLACSVPAPQNTAALGVIRVDQRLQIFQKFDVKKGHRLEPGRSSSVALRLHVGDDRSLDEVARRTALEARPLRGEQFSVGPGARFSGYDARVGCYAVGTARPESLRWLYEHPEVVASAEVSIHNQGPPRTIAVRHSNTVPGGRLGAGVATDLDGRALPLLVQNCKNFSGEDEEPFYNPGDPEYNESYFVLPLRQGERLALQSRHTFQNWGNHPIKQVGSLQAWMHYYQMSLGVTETTCHVPFRFGGHGGIWIADLRGISGQMWPGGGQPQYDNVGGHRIFHYRDAAGEHFPRYLRTRFRSTGPNLADWSMDYLTDGGEARLSLDIFEFPQTDVTRCFTTMRVEFDKPLRIEDARHRLRLISLDTTTQALRYEQFGYTDAVGTWQSVNPNEVETPLTARLSQKYPLVALSGNRRDSRQHGNNAILVRSFTGRADGKPLKQLATGLEKRRDDERMIWIAPDADELCFRKGDFLELQFVVIPYGDVGDGPEEALVERERFGVRGPAVVARQGDVAAQFPARVALSENGRAEFSMQGGYGTLPVLIEGFTDYCPPRLETMRRDRWEAVVMGDGNVGHQSYQTRDAAYGFVFLIDSDGRPLRCRVSEPRAGAETVSGQVD